MNFSGRYPEFLPSTLQTPHRRMSVKATSHCHNTHQAWRDSCRRRLHPSTTGLIAAHSLRAAAVCSDGGVSVRRSGSLSASGSEASSEQEDGMPTFRAAERVAWRWSPPTASSLRWATNHGAALIPSSSHTSVCVCAVKPGHGSISCGATRQRLGMD